MDVGHVVIFTAALASYPPVTDSMNQLNERRKSLEFH